jgi:hypothetical protein
MTPQLGDPEMTNVTSLTDRLPRLDPAALGFIYAMTIAETGWRRIDAQTMRFIGQPVGGPDGGRDCLQLKGRGRGLALTCAFLSPDCDPDDDEEVAEELEGEWDTVLGLPALYVLRTALDSVITALEAAPAEAARLAEQA